MEPTQIWTGVSFAAVVLGIHGAYYGALADTCLKIGTELSDASEGTTGFQDAITPPSSTNFRIINWLATLLLAGVSWYYIGFAGIAVFLVVRFVASLVSGASFKTDPPRKYFCRMVYSSMGNREADYAKAGDTMRSEAMNDLRTRFERSHFAKCLAQ
ncbi:hypothetical protein [uncultured Roseovarius sp.]|uniref:hypothetical protein n=1 Tax=uncultured Roseovarius sp. TaxID=293344 RepID=UPI0025D553CF|nr:hypothetical protein [uncultured Roseovarius sp.]